MIEQDIVNALKRNAKVHIIIHDLDNDIRTWINNNRDNIMIMDEDGCWDVGIDPVYSIKETDVFCLEADYELPKKPGGEWVEFEIDEEGKFHCFMKGFMFHFFWTNWNTFLADAYSSGYTAFGGWQYAACHIWFMDPVIFCEDDAVYHTIYADKDKPRPAIPEKIRFWRAK